MEQLAVYREGDLKLLGDYQRTIEAELLRLEDSLERALQKKPSEDAVRLLEERCRLVGAQRARLLSNGPSDSEKDQSPERSSIVDTMLTNHS